MKFLLLLLLSFILCVSAHAQTTNTAYNKVLADSLGADEYGMKAYILVILKAGPNKTTDKDKISSLFRGHLDNIGRLAEQGKLIVAGPLGKNEKAYRGIFILNVKTKEEAEAILDTDPAVKEQLLEAELYEWYGSAALPLYLKSNNKIVKKRP